MALIAVAGILALRAGVNQEAVQAN
jgi:hypothetical protein